MYECTRISIVEDTFEIRDALRKRINETDDLYCITDYDSGEDALKNLPHDQPDIVIMDIGLPGMNGIECMLPLKLAHPKMTFLMFTVFEDDSSVFDALKAGASGYILKGDKPSGVINAIREFQNGGGPMSPAISKKVMKSFHRFGPDNPNVEKLTSHQLRILQYLSDGLLNKEIADKLGIKLGSIKVQLNRIYTKLHVNNRVEAVNKYLGKNRV